MRKWWWIFFKLLKSADVVLFPVLAPVTLSSSTPWSEFLEEKLCSKQSVGYLKSLKFAFDAIPPPHRANSPLQAKYLTGLRTCCNKEKRLLSTRTFLFNQKKRPKSSKSSICFWLRLLFKNVFLFSLFQVFLYEILPASEISVSFTGVSQ